MDKITKLTKITNVNYGLENLLMGYTKTQQLEIADSLNSSVPKSWKKSKVAKELAEIIEEQAQTVYQEILEDVIGRFPSQEQSIYVVKSLESIVGLNPLIEKGFIFVQYVNESYMLIIPEEILKAAGMHNELVSEETKSVQSDFHAADIIHKWKENLLAIYGTVSAKHLHAVWNRHYAEQLSIDEIKELLSN
ncbi:hypothetical protein [Alkalibacterium sp.]|nr:MAG: hypothetical protein EA249_09360 [Alkalibacterium sp.]